MRLPDPTVLKGALERLIANCATLQDRDQVQAAFAAGVLSIATGERAASIGGDASGTVIVTGDGNVVLHVDGSGTSAIDRLLRRSPPSLLHQLPADVADFAGRGAQVERLLGILSAPGGRAAISAIDGMGGLGKTTLAVHVAHRLTEHYPDGQIVVDMAGTSAAPLSPAQSLARVIRAFEPLMQLPEAVEELRAIYLHVLSGKRVLVILDNALDGDQVAPLAPPEACALIVTARRRIAVAGLIRVDLDLLAPGEAIGLLRSIVGERATEVELSRIADLCGLLPLALRVGGMFLASSPHWSVAEFIAALADERQRLVRLRLEGSAPLDVAANLALSVGELRGARPDIAERWYELAAFLASFDSTAAAGVWDLRAEATRDVLGVLLSRSMVLYDTAQLRWRLHDLMRDLAGGRFAVEVLAAPADLAARLTVARRRHAEHYRGVLAAGDDLYLKGGAHVLSGLALFDLERRNIETGEAWASGCAADDPAAARLCVSYADAGAYVLDLRQHPYQRIAWLEAAARAARQIGDRRAEGAMLGNLGLAYANLGETRRAIELYEQDLVIAREIGDRRAEGNALGNLGNAYKNLGEPRPAIELYEQALVIAREIGDRRAEGNALGSLGLAYAALGDTRRAIELYEQNFVIVREIGDRRAEGNTLGNLGLAYAALGETRRAIELYEQRLVIAREIGDRRGEGNALGNLGLAYADLGETRRAIELHEQTLVIMREIGDRRGEGNALGNLGNAYADLGETRRAIELHEQALAISRSIGDRQAEGQDLGNLGIAYAALGETRRAIDLLVGALDIFEAIESPNAAQVRTAIEKLRNKGGT